MTALFAFEGFGGHVGEMDSFWIRWVIRVSDQQKVGEISLIETTPEKAAELQE